MPDVFDAAKRSEVMSHIRGKGNKTTEIALATAFRKGHITGWRRHIKLKLKVGATHCFGLSKMQSMVVTPDFIFRKAKLAVFVDGCFWHQCPLHSKVPENNREVWEEKLRRNVERDKQANCALKAAGWHVLRLWEHELLQPARAVHKVDVLLRRHSSR